MLAAVFVLACFCVAAVTAKDEPYWQEASFRSVFPEQPDVQVWEPNTPSPPSAAWDTLPFTFKKGMPKKGAVISAGNCMLALSDGVLYGSAEVTPAPPLTENPYGAWGVVGGLPSGDLTIMALDDASSKNGTVIFAATKDNVARVHLSAPSAAEPCGAVADVSMVLQDAQTQEWGTVTGLQVAPALDGVFIGTAQNGVFFVTDDATKPLTRVDMAGDASSTLLWVEKWHTLYTANDIALYTLQFCPQKKVIINEDHEWIGGILGTTPTDMDWDEDNSVVWIAETESIHKLTRDGTYWRMGYQQMAPMGNVSTLAVSQGQIFSGSFNLGMARVSGKQSPEQLDAKLTGDPDLPPAGGQGGDPWAWVYYYGPRWLPSDDVLAIVATGQRNRKSVVAVTGAGLTVMNVGQMTLKEKAAVEETYQNPRHNRHGLASSCVLKSPGVLSSWHGKVDDNDGLWTSMAAMGECYRYMSTKEPAARNSAWTMFEGLERLSFYSGAYPTFTARSISKLSEQDIGLPAELDPTCVNDCWYASPSEGWWYKGDTSSDELAGHFAAYPMIYDSIAQTPEEKDRVLALYDGMMGSIVDNDLYFIQPATGKRTLWGFWNPKEVNTMPEHYSERGTNSLEILAWLTGAYSVTGKQKYKDTYNDLVTKHKYVQNTINVKIDSIVDENHSDTELIMLAYQALFYAYERLPDGHARKEEVWEMVAPMLPSIQRTFLLLRGELSPLWLGIYAGCAAQKRYVSERDLEGARWNLRHWQLDNINWNIYGSQRMDLDISPTIRVRLSDSPDKPIMRHIRPAQERRASEWNNDPFDVNPGGDAGAEYGPGVFLLPYYIMSYYNLL